MWDTLHNYEVYAYIELSRLLCTIDILSLSGNNTGVRSIGVQVMPTMHALLESFMSQQDGWRAYLLKNWDGIVGELHTRISLEHIRGTTVVIGVHDLHWMHELSCLSHELLFAINRAFDKPYVTHIRFVLSKRHRTEQRKQPVAIHASRCNTEKQMATIQPRQLSERHQTALALIDDAQLQDILRNLMRYSTP